MQKCSNETCSNIKASDRAECHSCRGKRRRGNCITKWRSDGSPRILFLDIETYPSMVYTWGMRNVDISIEQIIEPGGLSCLAAKWYGSNEIEFYSKWNQGERSMIKEAWRLLDEADIIVHYYGSRFDVPHLNAEFLRIGDAPYQPFKQVDLKMAVSRRFKLPSNKLQFVSQVLKLAGKEEHEGFRLWRKVEEGDVDAQNRMEVYNKRDTVLLEECYEVLLPWLPDHPHRNLYDGNSSECPRCGSNAGLLEAGWAYTKLSKFAQYQCAHCNSYFRSSRRVEGVKLQDSMF